MIFLLIDLCIPLSQLEVHYKKQQFFQKKEIIIEYRIRGMIFPKEKNSLLKKKSSLFPKYSTLFKLKYFLKKRG